MLGVPLGGALGFALVRGISRALAEAVAKMKGQRAQAVSGVRAHSENVATASADIAQVNHDLSQRTEEQASALQLNAALVEESAAATESLKMQERQLVQTVAVFKVSEVAAEHQPAVSGPAPALAGAGGNRWASL